VTLGGTALNHFVLGNTGDALPRNARMGDWRLAEVRPACYRALERPETDRLAPRLPTGEHRIDIQDGLQARDMTVALSCYLVTQRNAVCEPNNRAYIVDYVGRYIAKKQEMLATASRYGEGEVRTVRALWDSPRNREIDGALEAMIRQGRIAKADFGWSAPEPLRPLLDRHAAAADGCRGEAAWAPVPIRQI
jgi:hypothetical protein